VCSCVCGRCVFRMDPYFRIPGSLLTFVVLPFGYHLSATSMNVGLFYVISITALVVVGILISGWASNSKWSLFGGIRAAAQVVSYELPSGMVILVPILLAGPATHPPLNRSPGRGSRGRSIVPTPQGLPLDMRS